MGYKDPEKKREYQRLWMRNRRLSYIGDSRCAKCGSDDRLEIDHREPASKTSDVGGLWSYNEDTRETELVKCQILCFGCHKAKTSTEAPKGEDASQAKLTEEDVLAIRSRYKEGGISYRKLAVEYGVDHTNIRWIIKRKTWNHV